jgi:hypothetical protein
MFRKNQPQPLRDTIGYSRAPDGKWKMGTVPIFQEWQEAHVLMRL